MANLREVSRKLRVAMAVLIGLNVLAAGALLYMWVRGSSALPSEFDQLRQLVVTRKASVVPPESLNTRIKDAREQIAKLYEDRFPRSSGPIFETLGNLARENRVNLTQASYKVSDTDLPNVRQVEITADLNGDYAQTVRFINALERAKLFMLVDGVKLAEQEGGRVKLNIHIQAYMKGQA
jgi:hypothetical protein